MASSGASSSAMRHKGKVHALGGVGEDRDGEDCAVERIFCYFCLALRRGSEVLKVLSGFGRPSEGLVRDPERAELAT